MRKALLIFILIVLFSQLANAQKRDTLLYAIDNNDKVVSTKASAVYFLYIMPKDSATNLYPIIETYRDGKRKLVGASQSNLYYALALDGPVVSYYPNGHKQSIVNYSAGGITGDIINYYPNGKIYTIKKKGRGIDYLVECRDSTGTVLATNGNGKWIVFNNDFKQKFQEGPVTDSLANGEWHETYSDTSRKYTIIYKNGMEISSTDPYMVSYPQVFTSVEYEPYFDGFRKFLA